jgi:hypothetical protein
MRIVTCERLSASADLFSQVYRKGENFFLKWLLVAVLDYQNFILFSMDYIKVHFITTAIRFLRRQNVAAVTVGILRPKSCYRRHLP